MKVGIIIARIGGIDGVALETEKWISVLHRMGHEVFVAAGQFEKRKINTSYETRIQELSLFSPENHWGQKKAFFETDVSSAVLMEHFELYSSIIRDKLMNWIHRNHIDLVISENASALPINISLGVGIKKLLEQTGMPAIAHDHDYAWERGDRYQSPFEEVNKLIYDTFPLRLPNVHHAVINTAAQQTLREKYQRDS